MSSELIPPHSAAQIILTFTVVDGASWRMNGGSPGGGWEYPDFLLSGAQVEGVKGGKKSKL